MAVAWYWSVAPGTMLALKGVTAIEETAGVALVTVRKAVPMMLPLVAVIVAVPAMSPLARPALLTPAIDGFELDQVTEEVRF